MPTAKELREQRHALIVKSRKEILDKAEGENRDLSSDEQAQWLKIMGGIVEGKPIRGEVDVLADRINRLETSEKAEAELSARAGDGKIGRGPLSRGGDGAELAATDEQRALAIQAWLRANNDHGLSDRHLEACRASGVNPHSPRLNLNLFPTETSEGMRRAFSGVHRSRGADEARRFLATMGTMPGTAGGFLIPPETLLRELEINMLWYGGMRQVAETITTATGERISWPTADDTTNTGVQLGEAAAAMPPGAASVDPVLGKVYWDAYKFSSKPILVNYELLEDSAFNLVRILGELMGIRLGRITNTKYTVGTGAATAKGLITAATTFAAASATSIGADDLFGLFHSVDVAYRTADSGFMMHDTIVLALRKLKDGMGRYLWQDGLQSNTPDRILGHPLSINNDMDSTTVSGKKTVAFGKLSNYKIRRVGKVRMYRLEERYRDTDQDGFVTLIREDGNLLTAGTAPVKVLTH